MTQEVRKVIVSPYPIIADYLRAKGIVPTHTPYFRKVKLEWLVGSHIYGALPVWLARYAKRVTEYSIIIPAGRDVGDFTFDDVEQYLRRPINTYQVSLLDTNEV